MRRSGRLIGILIVLAVAAVGGYYAWRSYLAPELPDGFASSNGRIEATEIDVATKIAGRVEEIFVDEGDFVEAGAVLARMDTSVLKAQLREAEAQLSRQQVSVDTAKSLVAQRQAERGAADAVVAQHEAEAELPADAWCGPSTWPSEATRRSSSSTTIAWPRAWTTLDRRQGTAGRDHQSR
jgi:HlyD family secretion protein